MIVCLFGTTYRDGYDVDLESRLDAVLSEELKGLSGFLSFHMYTAPSGEVLGVIRFDSRQALEDWRDNALHRSVWKHAPELYESFWIQSCETYREYSWTRAMGRTGENMAERFARDPANMIGQDHPDPVAGDVG